MLTKWLLRVRSRHHPLHHLRKNKFLRNRVLPNLDHPVFVRLHGVDWPVRVRLLKNLSYVIDNRIVEPEIAALFLAINKLYRPHTFWDIGANVGFYSWLLLSHHPDATAYLFEPDPENLRLLNETKGRSKIARAEIVPVAVSDHDGTEEFSLDEVSGATGGLNVAEAPFIARHYGATAKTIAVRTLTMDSACRMFPAPDLVKIDVEGAQGRVLDGGRQTIEQHRPIIIMENTGSADTAGSQLKNMDYLLIGADRAGGSDETSDNILAIPPRLRHSIDRLFMVWKEIYAEWVGDSVRSRTPNPFRQ